MENCKEDIPVKIITPMFSYGVNKKKPEFRLTELKSSMRYGGGLVMVLVMERK